MKRAAINAFRLAIMLGMACAGIFAPGFAGRLSHPIVLGDKCKTTFHILLESPEYYKTFAYVTGHRGYACASDVGNQAAQDKCDEHGVGKCKVYARSPVNGKVQIVWEGKHRHAVAVIIGNRDYEGRTPNVQYAANDADAVRQFVIDTASIGEWQGRLQESAFAHDHARAAIVLLGDHLNLPLRARS